jgi:membrane-associated phospholipid phosphatase
MSRVIPPPHSTARRRLPPAYAALGLATATLLTLLVAALLLDTLPMDAAVRDALLAWTAPPAAAALRLINRAGDWRALLPGTLLLFLVFARARRHWWIWLTLMVLVPISEWLLKHAVGRPRPEDASLGFPSGHAAAAAAFFGAVVYLAGSLRRPWLRSAVRAGAVTVIVLVAVARVVLRAHWPSDALAGVALGLGLASAAALAAALQAPKVRER